MIVLAAGKGGDNTVERAACDGGAVEEGATDGATAVGKTLRTVVGLGMINAGAVVVVAATVVWLAVAGPHPPTRINSRAHRRFRTVDKMCWPRRKKVGITDLDGFDIAAGSRLLDIRLSR